jgi:hypothetical protein
MRFNSGLPQLAFVVGCSSRQQPEEAAVLDPSGKVMRTILQVRDEFKNDIFVYLTTSPRRCLAFGGITAKQTPTAVVHGSRNGRSFRSRMLDLPVSAATFDTATVVGFVRRVLAALQPAAGEGAKGEEEKQEKTEKKGD